ncbi:MAG: hypothetical protein ABIS67_14905 [Candidatus Eisenbacteria bacterium]
MNRSNRILLGVWIALILGGAGMLMTQAGAPLVTRETIFWLVACFAGEVLWVRLPAGAATVSMAACFNFAALLVLAPREAVPVAALATLTAELAVMRKSPVRALFNAGQTALAVALARACFDACGGRGVSVMELVSGLQLLPLLAAAVAYYALNRAAVVIAVALAQSIGLRESWRRNFGSAYDVLSTGAAFSLGALLATHYAGIGMVGTLFVALPLVLACDGYRRFARDAKASEPEAHSERRAA